MPLVTSVMAHVGKPCMYASTVFFRPAAWRLTGARRAVFRIFQHPVLHPVQADIAVFNLQCHRQFAYLPTASTSSCQEDPGV